MKRYSFTLKWQNGRFAVHYCVIWMSVNGTETVHYGVIWVPVIGTEAVHYGFFLQFRMIFQQDGVGPIVSKESMISRYDEACVSPLQGPCEIPYLPVQQLEMGLDFPAARAVLMT